MLMLLQRKKWTPTSQPSGQEWVVPRSSEGAFQRCSYKLLSSLSRQITWSHWDHRAERILRSPLFCTLHGRFLVCLDFYCQPSQLWRISFHQRLAYWLLTTTLQIYVKYIKASPGLYVHGEYVKCRGVNILVTSMHSRLWAQPPA